MQSRTATRRRALRRWGAAAAVVGGLLVTVPVANAVDSGPPAGLVWVGRPPSADTSTLYRAGAGGTVRRQPLPWSLNAIGCAPDGSVYGLAASRHGERFRDGPHPVRVRPDGAVDDLGPVTADVRHPLSSGHAAALRTGPGATVTLVVASGDALREVRLRPGPPRLTATRPLPDAATTAIGDWALDARGDLVTVTRAGGRAALLRLAGPTLRPVRTRVTGLPPGSNYGGAAVARDGSLYVVHHRATGRGTIYRVTPSGTARRVTTVDPAESSDAAMCPGPRPAPSVAPSVAPSAAPSSVGPAPAVPAAVAVPPANRPPVPRQAARTPVTPERPTGPAPGPRPGAATRPRPHPAVAAPPREPRVTTRLIPVVGALLLGAVVAVRLIRRNR
ncbi:hypothetical protein [Virgisporangium ochraceum]|uniref:Uncharacterized protein n=1 Tax=Virgisporangium ochraceum TaxID=65505 RepID=A0A8J4EHK5_9ACTN|nr:hypothetical protein [Virgisporangium ochraceum]GIJ74818.1 hypothetical protein Voc01_097350 [Virgisporangium ochraceum]